MRTRATLKQRVKLYGVQAPQAQTEGATGSSLEMALQDGATTWLNGSQGLDEPEFDVNVKLADLQDDPNNTELGQQRILFAR